MDLTSKETIQRLCSRNRIYPSKQRGQNFLINHDALDKILKAADLGKDDVVLEIGPGFGVLTVELAKRVKRVIAAEADKRLAKALREILAEYKNVEIIQEDILKLQITNYKLQNYKYKIVANLPYQITSAIFRKFLENEPRPTELVVMVQKEVAERICAKPGKMSVLSVSVQFFGRPEIVSVVPHNAFWPEPEVDSAILKVSQIKNRSEANLKQIRFSFALNSLSDLREFFRIVRIGFSSRRKQLHNNLAAGLRLPNEIIKNNLIECGFNQKVRAEDLSVEDWIKLTQRFVKF